MKLLTLLMVAGSAHAGTVDVAFDIKPTSCPNPFNPGEPLLNGTLPTAVLGDDDVDASRIVRSTLVIVVPEGGGLGEILIPPIHTGLEDVATPVEDNTDCACTEDGPDGYTDLTAHFDHDAVEAALGSVLPGDEIPLCIRGEFEEGVPFEGCDCILIVGPLSVEHSGWGRVKAGYHRR